jgi:hypothetical protein
MGSLMVVAVIVFTLLGSFFIWLLIIKPGERASAHNGQAGGDRQANDRTDQEQLG